MTHADLSEPDNPSPQPSGRALSLLVVITLISYPAGLALGQPWLLPLMNALPAYFLMARLLRRGERAAAIRAMLTWAASLILFGTLALACWPSDPGAMVYRGEAYQREMFEWIRTGAGQEGSLRLFLPQHLVHLASFVILGLATASAVSITLGATMVNYMNYYVASLARAGAPAWTVILLGWQPWALCRVAAFCILGVVLAEPLLSRVLSYRYRGIGAAHAWLLGAGLLIAADWTLKAILASVWGVWLRSALP